MSTPSELSDWLQVNIYLFYVYVTHRQSKEASILWTHEETRELPGERDNARNNARCTQASKTMHGMDGQHQDMDRTPCGRVNQNDRGQGLMEERVIVQYRQCCHSWVFFH